MSQKTIQRDVLFYFISSITAIVHLINHLIVSISNHLNTQVKSCGIPLHQLVILHSKKKQLEECAKVLEWEGGGVGYNNNHSLRATSTTRMYQHDVDEQQIMEGPDIVAQKLYEATREPQLTNKRKCQVF